MSPSKGKDLSFEVGVYHSSADPGGEHVIGNLNEAFAVSDDVTREVGGAGVGQGAGREQVQFKAGVTDQRQL